GAYSASAVSSKGRASQIRSARRRINRQRPGGLSGPESSLDEHGRRALSFDSSRRPGYTVNMEFKRITANPRQMGGVPCLRGLRIPVATVVSLVAEGQSVERILALYPDLEAEDVREALF